MNILLVIGALLGFVSVAFGAYAEHGLKSRLSAEAYGPVMTALGYHQMHAILIAAIGLALLHPALKASAPLLAWAGWLLVAGVVFFSFSLYLAALLSIPEMSRLAPLGGLLLMAGWLTLVWAGLKA